LLALQERISKTIIFVSHDLDEAMKLGNTIAIMESGRIVQAGTAEDILLRPADSYVAEFVKHVNPLNVLRGNTVMTPAAALPREGDKVLAGPEGRISITVDQAGCPTGVEIDGRTGVIANADSGPVPCDVIIAPVDLKLQQAIALKQRSDNPILLVDKLGRLAGLCDNAEIYRGLLRNDLASRPRDA
jgi:glycine betaine/proline transport system ATP-binding protein